MGRPQSGFAYRRHGTSLLGEKGPVRQDKTAPDDVRRRRGEAGSDGLAHAEFDA